MDFTPNLPLLSFKRFFLITLVFLTSLKFVWAQPAIEDLLRIKHDAFLAITDSLLNDSQQLSQPYKAQIFFQQGNAYKDLGWLQKAEKSYIKALKSLQNQGLPELEVNVLVKRAIVLTEIDQINLALKLIAQANAIIEKNQLPNLNEEVNLALAAVYSRQQNMAKAKECLLVCINSYSQPPIDIEGLKLSYLNLGVAFGRVDQLDSSKYYLKKAEKLYFPSNNFFPHYTYINSAINTNLGNVFFLLDSIDAAKSYFRKAIHLDGNEKFHIGLYKDYYNLANLFQYINQFDSAYFYLEKFDSLKSIVIGKQVKNDINELNILYETEKKENQIALQQAKINQQNLRQQALIFGVISLCIVLIFLFISIVSYKQKVKTQAQLIAQSKKIHQQEINKMIDEQEINTLNALLKGQEEERKRVSKDLHDRVGSLLSTLKLYWAEQYQKQSNQKNDNILQLVNESIAEVRRISHNLGSGVLDKFGLSAALNDLAQKVNASQKIKVFFHVDYSPNFLDKSIEIEIYRIAQELMSNSLKHAQATEINMQLIQQNNEVEFSFEDNGIGFDLNKQDIKKGIGLENLLARIKSIKAEYQLDTQPGKGIFFSAKIWV